MNNPFKDYTEKSMSEVQIKAKHKAELAQKMFGNQSEKKPFWNWTKAIFTAPVVATIAIVFFLNFNKEVVQEVLLPQEALAQALKNTFNPQIFYKTFGFPDDDLFHHRTISLKNLNDPNGSDLEYQIQNIDLWFDGLQTRKDSKVELENLTMFNSIMANAQDDLCSTMKLSIPECVSLEKTQEERVNQILSSEGMFHPVLQDRWLNDLKAKTITNTDALLEAHLSWSTTMPINRVMVSYGSALPSINTGTSLNGKPDDYVYFDELNFINEKKNNEYWHSVTMDQIDPNFFSNDIYFQIVDRGISLTASSEPPYHDEGMDVNAFKQASMVYKFNLDDQILTELLPEKIISEVKSYTTSQEILDDILRINLAPAFYVMKNPEEFETPNSVENTEFNGQKVIKLNYNLSSKFFLQYGYSVAFAYEKYTIDLFMDQAKSQFLGYTIKGDEKELNSIWIKDEILPNSQKRIVFDKSQWLDLANQQYEYMKPFDN